MSGRDQKSGAATLLADGPRVANIGLARFADDLTSSGATVVHVAWSPPAGGNAKLGRLLAKLGS
jgi:FdrA protein